MSSAHALFIDLTRAYAEEHYPRSPDVPSSVEAYAASDHTFRFVVWLAALEPEYVSGLAAMCRELFSAAHPAVYAEQAQFMREYVRRNAIPRRVVEESSRV